MRNPPCILLLGSSTASGAFASALEKGAATSAESRSDLVLAEDGPTMTFFPRPRRTGMICALGSSAAMRCLDQRLQIGSRGEHSVLIDQFHICSTSIQR